MRWIAQNFKALAIALPRMQEIALKGQCGAIAANAAPGVVKPSLKRGGNVKAWISNFRPPINLALGSGSVYA